jgi:uncharacterized protein with HEPN domain
MEKAVGRRDLIIPRNFGGEQDIVWNVAKEKPPKLNADLRRILSNRQSVRPSQQPG